MAKRPNQRLKLLYLAKIMLRLTDDEHGLQVEQIINELAKYDIAAERKSIYSDLEALQLFGIDIEKKHIGRYVYYCVGNRNLELAELKLLVDAVQSSKFITEKKSSQLIEKLERYVSQYEAKQLNQGSLSYLKGKEKELLLLLMKNYKREFTPIEVSKELKVTNKTVINRLATLVKNGFVIPNLVKERIRSYELSDFTKQNEKEIRKLLK